MNDKDLVTNQTIRILRFVDREWTANQRAQLDAVFFAASATQTFGNAADRAAFYERWLGRFLRTDAAHAFVALDKGDQVVGYLVGSVRDIARQARFADLATARAFAAHSAVYPAHLHINLAAEARNRGIGRQLVDVFSQHAAEQGAFGVHVVTSAASRNVSFYRRCGFSEVARFSVNVASANVASADLVFLARRLT